MLVLMLLVPLPRRGAACSLASRSTSSTLMLKDGLLEASADAGADAASPALMLAALARRVVKAGRLGLLNRCDQLDLGLRLLPPLAALLPVRGGEEGDEEDGCSSCCCC